MGNSNAKIVHSGEESVSISCSQEISEIVYEGSVNPENFLLLPLELGHIIFSYVTKVR